MYSGGVQGEDAESTIHRERQRVDNGRGSSKVETIHGYVAIRVVIAQPVHQRTVVVESDAVLGGAPQAKHGDHDGCRRAWDHFHICGGQQSNRSIDREREGLIDGEIAHVNALNSMISVQGNVEIASVAGERELSGIVSDGDIL